MSSTATKAPFADASPAEIREAILPEERHLFDEEFRAALDAMAETLGLAPLEEFLTHWRRTAWMHSANGHDGWRRVLAMADYTSATGGEIPSPKSSTEEIRALAAERHAGR